MNAIVELKCPSCGRFLSETNGYARAVCPKCGWEVTVRSKDERMRVDTSRQTAVT